VDIFYEKQTINQLKKIPKVEIKKINSKIVKLSQNPRIGKSLKGELDGLYSLRAWPYRILYEITKTSIIICSIAHRQGIYKK
jgi:mRNA-degrading endonuclease RelE of RelBE toxin-antitoxin system